MSLYEETCLTFGFFVANENDTQRPDEPRYGPEDTKFHTQDDPRFLYLPTVIGETDSNVRRPQSEDYPTHLFTIPRGFLLFLLA